MKERSGCYDSSSPSLPSEPELVGLEGIFIMRNRWSKVNDTLIALSQYLTAIDADVVDSQTHDKCRSSHGDPLRWQRETLQPRAWFIDVETILRDAVSETSTVLFEVVWTDL